MFVFKKLAIVSLISMAVPTLALAHAYVASPPSRAQQCKLEKDVNYAKAFAKCGQIANEPQGLEAKKNFPAAGPADKRLASADGKYPELDVQTSTAWHKSPMEAGPFTFRWGFGALHATAKWEYYMTKQDWNPNAPLTRASFDLTPFCRYEKTQLSDHNCNVPKRTGYQIIYAVWEIGDTDNSFYNVIDVQFSDSDSSKPSLWSELLTGTLSGTDLKVGDTVYARFYNNKGAEITSRMVSLEITDPSKVTAAQWSLELAKKINSSSSDMRAGIKDASGNVNPIAGANNVYTNTQAATSVDKVSISYKQNVAVVGATVGTVVGEKIENKQSKISFDLDAKGMVVFEAKVTDANNVEKGKFGPITVNNSKQNFDIPMTNVAPGEHRLVYNIKTTAGGVIASNQVKSFILESGVTPSPNKYEFTFPAGLTSYKAGTLVLQPKNDNVYRCKPFPYSGYCKQWSPSATGYEPGVGSAWTSAWEKVN